MSKNSGSIIKIPTILNEEKPRRIRRSADAVQLVITLIVLAIFITLGIIASNTNAALSQDLSTLSRNVGKLFQTPLLILNAIVSIAIPAVVVIKLISQREFKQLLLSLISATIALGIGILVVVSLIVFSPEALRELLEITSEINRTPPIAISTTGLCSLLTVAGPRHTMKVLQLSWNTLFFTLLISVLGSEITLAAAILTFLLGRIVGLSVRYVFGSYTNRMYGDKLVEAFTHAGLYPNHIERIILASSELDKKDFGQYFRKYQLTLSNKQKIDIKIFDEEYQIPKTVLQLWQSLKIRTYNFGGTLLSTRQIVTQEALATAIAANTTVKTPKLVTVAEIQPGCMLLATEHIADLKNIASIEINKISDSCLVSLWDALEQLHNANMSLNRVGLEEIMVDKHMNPWFTNLSHSKAGATEFSKKTDIAQMLVSQSILVGADRALEIAYKNLGIKNIINIAPLLQKIVLTKQTKENMKSHKNLLQILREKIINKAPEANIVPAQLSRFSARSLITIGATTIAAYILLSQLADVDPIAIFQETNIFWVFVSLSAAMLAYLGATWSLLGVSPIKLNFRITFLVQIATSFAALFVPAGVGSATVNLSYLRKNKIKTNIAVARLALLQVINLLVITILVIFTSVLTGTQNETRFFPSRGLLVSVVVAAILLSSVFLFPKVRDFAKHKLLPLFEQALPEFLKILGHPYKILQIFGGTTFTIVTYLIAFYASVNAFGVEINLLNVVLIFLIGNFLASVAPTPGGLGAVETSLIGGLTLTGGLSPSLAFSIILLYRVITFWFRALLGWVAFRWLQKKKIL